MTKQSKFLSRIPTTAWLVWGLAAAFFFLEYIIRVSPEVMVPQLMRDFKVTALGLGNLSAFFYYTYVAMQVPVGVMADKFGPRKLLTSMAFLCAIGSILFSMSHHLYLAEFSRLIIGFSSAAAFVCALKLASTWFPLKRFAIFAGLTQTIGMIGAAVGEGPFSVMVNHLGWRHATFIGGIVIFGLFIMVYLFVRDNPEKPINQPTELKQQPKPPILTSLKTVLRNPQTWYVAAYAGLVYCPTAAFAELWGVPFLTHVYHLSRDLAATGVSAIFIGWGVGGPLMGYLTSRIGCERILMFLSALSGAIILTSLILLHNLSTPVIFTLLFTFGLTNTGVVIAYALSGVINPLEQAATSIAFVNMASVLIGAAFQPIIGWVIDLHWSGKMANGIPIYTSSDYRTAIIVLPICLVLGAIASLIIRRVELKTA